MAEAAKKDTEAKLKAVDAGAQAVAAKPKADFLGLGLLLLGVVNLLTLAGMGYFTQKMWSKVQDLQSATQKLAASQTKDDESVVGKEMEAPAMGLLYPMDSFLVNIASDQGPKFLQTQMELELADPATEDEIARKKAALRDAIIVLLSSRSYKELREPSGMKALRQDLLRAINNLLTTGKIKEIYFTQFHFN